MHVPGLPRVIEKGDRYKVIRFPMWTSESMIREACKNMQRDAEVEGRTITFKIGHRLVRVEGDLKDSGR